MNNCPACAALERAVEKAQQEHNQEKETLMRKLLSTHKNQHQPVAVVVWKDGTKWQVTHTWNS